MTADVFVVTQTGLDGATSAAGAGIFLQLTTFKVGTGVGYTPTKSDTALHGTILYSDNITSFSTAADGSLIVNCTIDVNAGPFDFGEVGIYTSTGALFALMALPQLEHKYTALGSNVASTFTFQCYLRLGQAGGIIQIVTGGGGGGGGGTSNFVYSMQTGQPTALWGSNNSGVDSYVWNPSNFNVNTAKGIQSGVTGFYNAEGHTWHRADGTTVLATLDTAGVFLANNVGTISDERLKKDLVEINDDEAFVIACNAQGLTYELLSEPGIRRPGVSAQQFQKLMSEAVHTTDEGLLSVLYGQAALALLPSVARKVQALIDDVETIKRKVPALME